MTKKIIISIALFFTLFTLSAADKDFKVDLNRIKVETATNPDLYRALLNRFVVGDSTLTMDEMATVYYGYAFTIDYMPTDNYDAIQESYTQGKYAETWHLCEEALKYNPVSLDLTIKALVSATNCNLKNAQAMIPALQNRYELISTLILMSGKGTDVDSPFIVICEQDINRILRNVICVESIIGQTGIRNLVAYKVKLAMNDRQHILYFDNNLQKEYEKLHGE